jgi:hypothetical protein
VICLEEMRYLHDNGGASRNIKDMIKQKLSIHKLNVIVLKKCSIGGQRITDRNLFSSVKAEEDEGGGDLFSITSSIV